MALIGCNFVRFTRHGLQSIRKSWDKTGDKFEVRRQGLKLRFWDERHTHPPGMLFDHSYESIKSLPGLGIYELRLDDAIGGRSNIRIVFFDPPKEWEPSLAEKRPMRIVWVLEALPKKRNDWTDNEITRFRTLDSSSRSGATPDGLPSFSPSKEREVSISCLIWFWTK